MMRSLALNIIAGVLFAWLSWNCQGAGDSVDEELGSEWRYIRGLAEPHPSFWRRADYDDSNWKMGLMPFHNRDLAEGTPLLEMGDRYSCIFLRQRFCVADFDELTGMQLEVICSGGFIVWINSAELFRYNLPGGLVDFKQSALEGLTEIDSAKTHILPIPSPGTFVSSGTNIIAIQAFCKSTNEASDFMFHARFRAVINTSAPRVIQVLPVPGSRIAHLDTVEVFFDKPVANVDAVDLAMNKQPATRLEPVGRSQYIFGFSNPVSGPVELAWTSGHGIVDVTFRSNAFAGGPWFYTVDPALTEQGLVINEFMADNENGLRDEDRDRPDWIELYHGGGAPVSLAGWYLTDSRTNLTQWQFPDVVMLTNSYLVVYASGKDRRGLDGPLHANFKLTPAGEYLALVKPDGRTVVSEFAPTYPSQTPDVSYGRVPGKESILAFFHNPTPGRINDYRDAAYAPAVQFSQPGGVFQEPFILALEAPGSNAVIRFTLDDSVPTAESPRYSAPILITNTVVVRARSYQAGLPPGPPRSELYLLSDPTVRVFESDLPVLIIQNLGAKIIPKSLYQPAQCVLWEPIDGRAHLTNAPAMGARAGIKLRGSSTAGNLKRNLALEWRDEFDQDLDLETLGMPSDSDWVLYAPGYLEPVLIHNPFMYQLSNDIGRYAPRTRFVEVFLHTGSRPLSNLDYQGIYVLTEKIKRSKERVNIDKLQATDHNPPAVTGGYLLKFDRLGWNETGLHVQGLDRPVIFVEPEEEEIRLSQWESQFQYIRRNLDEFQNVLTGPDGTDPERGYAGYIDVDSWIDHHLLNVLAFNLDALGNSTYFTKPREGKLAFGPIWDFDRALGSRSGHDENPRTWRSTGEIVSSDVFNSYWWGPLFADLEFWQRYIDRWQALRAGQFSTGSLNGLIDQLASQITYAQPREVMRWPSFSQPLGGSYAAEVAAMKSWLDQRLRFVDSHFVACPQFSMPSGRVAPGVELVLEASLGTTLYYTIDGTDPRLRGGGVASTARLYSQPIPLFSSTRIRARAYNPAHSHPTGQDNPPLCSSWSGLAEGDYEIAYGARPVDVLINEAFFQTTTAAAADGTTKTTEGWVELFNPTLNSVNLTGFYLTNTAGMEENVQPFPEGIVLAPGEFVLIGINKDLNPDQTNGNLQVTIDLSKPGSLAGLVNPEGALVDSIATGQQVDMASRGRIPDGGPKLVQMRPATPKAPNYLGCSLCLPNVIIQQLQSDGTTLLMWEAVPGRSYRIEYRLENDPLSAWIPMAGLHQAALEIESLLIPPHDGVLRVFRPVVADPAPRITMLNWMGNGYLSLFWEAVPGRYYQVEQKLRAENASWHPLDYLVYATKQKEYLLLPVPLSDQHFYRIVLLE